MKKYLTLSILLLVNINIFSQFSLEWQQRYNGTGNNYDEATSLWIDAARYVYVCGESDGTGSDGGGSSMDMVVVKYSPDGLTEWSARYNGPANAEDHGYLVKADAQGNVYVSGSSSGVGTGLDYCLIKYNSAGVQQWVYRYNGPGNATDEIYSFQVENSGNVYLTGYSNGGASGDDIFTVKLNSAGNLLWSQRVNGSENNDDYGNSLQIDAQGNCYVTGAVTTGTDLDYITIKYNSGGTQMWAKTYNGPASGEDFPSSNAIDNAGNIYVVGYSFGTGTGSDYCTIKYNNNGDQQWVQRYNGPGNGVDEAFNILLDAAGNVYITGNSYGGAQTMDDYCTIKYSNGGQQQWVARYDGTGKDDYANWVSVDPTGNVYVTGLSQGSNNIDDMATIGYNSAGTQIWVDRFNGIGNEYDSGNSMALDNAGGVYITGGSDNVNNTDFITIKYSSTIGIQQYSNEIPKEFSLKQNYPNPFNPSTKIKFNLPVGAQNIEPVKLIVYNIIGSQIAILLNQSLRPGVYEVNWDASNNPSGVYYYKLITGSFTETKKMILIK